MRRGIYRSLGLFFTGLGIVGVFLPILPTTPFLLLALWFFTRSSERLKHWLLTNKLCGRFINDYYSGRGIPLRVKLYIITLLWATILLSIYFVDMKAVQLLLFAVAVGVTIHVARFKTKQMYKKITILLPTKMEAAAFPKRLPFGVSLVVCGVGLAEVAATTYGELAKEPDLIILAGIAGAYPDSRLSAGESCVVESERIGDLGAFRGEEFKPLFTKEYHSPVAQEIQVLKRVASCSVNSSASSHTDYSGDRSAEESNGQFAKCQIENMEGASFFALCEAAKVDFVEVRTISNFTTDSRDEWRVEEALLALSDAVFSVINELRGVVCEES